MPPKKLPPAPKTYLHDPDVPVDFIADGVRYTVRRSLMTPAIDRQLYASTGFSFGKLYHAVFGDGEGAPWMMAAFAFVAQAQQNIPTSFALMELRFPYDREIEFEMWPAIDGDDPEAEGVSS